MLVRSFPKEKPVEDERYRAFINGKPCSVSRKPGPSVAHHQPEKGKSTMGGKCSDRRCVPLAQKFHDEYHRIGRESFQRKYPWWKPEKLIERYNREYDSQQEA